MVGLVTLLGAVLACDRAKPSSSVSEPGAEQATSKPPPPESDALPPSDLETRLPEPVRNTLLTQFTGDFDEMIQRQVVRVGVTRNRTFYFVDRGVQHGVAYDYGQLMEQRINQMAPRKYLSLMKHLQRRAVRVNVFFVPMSREKLVPALLDGKVDLAAGSLTITPELNALVDFTDPTRTNVDQMVVTGPGSVAMNSLEDLSGQRIFVRRMSAYENSLLTLNEKLAASAKAPVVIETAPENLEDDDLLEMVNAGLLPAVVVDDYVARFWKKVFPNVVVQEAIAIRSGGSLGIAVRKNSPKLRAALNTFMGKYGLGTAFGEMVERRYLVDTRYVKNAAAEAERKKFLAVVQLFRNYSDAYGMDFLLMAAQGYQESRLDQSVRSPVGAIGIMQLMPATGEEMHVGDIRRLEPNIHAGVKYMRSLLDSNFNGEPMDALNKGLFTFASYNAGPGRIRQLRREAERQGLDPNVWFGNVEQIASERIGRETVTYVSNIYKYYVAYRLVVEDRERRDTVKAAVKASSAQKKATKSRASTK
jgi:membrane-bound lytic murein transglycosylase MltF